MGSGGICFIFWVGAEWSDLEGKKTLIISKCSVTCKHLSTRCRFTKKLIQRPQSYLQSRSLSWQIAKNQTLSAAREMWLIRQHSERNNWLFYSEMENCKRSCFIRDFKRVEFCLCCSFFFFFFDSLSFQNKKVLQGSSNPAGLSWHNLKYGA